jgi:hypothetical protein
VVGGARLPCESRASCERRAQRDPS